jgi:hypothetical protein
MPISAPPPSWASIKNKPTTMSGFGITDEKCRAWVNFNGIGTVAIRASYNVSSITDNGVGDYTVNFTSAMSDANYATVVTGNGQLVTDYNNNFCAPYGQVPTTSAVRICSVDSGGVISFRDMLYFSVSIFR